MSLNPTAALAVSRFLKGVHDLQSALDGTVDFNAMLTTLRGEQFQRDFETVSELLGARLVDEPPAKNQLTTQQKVMFEELHLPHDNAAVIAATLQEHPVAVVAYITDLGGGRLMIQPQALLCDDLFMKVYGDELLDPAEGAPVTRPEVPHGG